MSAPFVFADPAALLAVPNGAVHVQVTADDLAHGRRFQPCQCPVALALSRQFGLPNWCITVGNGDVLVRNNEGRVIRWWRMDETGRGFRVFWDAGQRGQEPVAFTLIPQPVPYMDADAFWLTSQTVEVPQWAA